jgi:hypothetical protein
MLSVARLAPILGAGHGFSMGSGGKGRKKGKQKIQGQLRTKKDAATIP